MKYIKIITTRKPSWRKGKRATAVHVRRPLAKKSTANFQLMVNIVTVAANLRFANCEIFSDVEVENRHFHPRYCDCRPPEERPAIYQRNLCIADSTGLSSFVLPLLPLKSAKSREIRRKFKRIAVQGHPRSSTLLPIESACASSY